MTCIILDDEPLAVKLLKEYASSVPDLEIVYAGTDAFQALKLAQEGRADLVFLDIQMPELNGIQFLKILNGRCRVILTTAYDEYALQAFDFDVVDYLLKPFSPERFTAALQRVRERMQPSTAVSRQEELTHIFVKSEYRIVRLELTDIFYMESLRDYVAIHHRTGKTMTLQSLRSFEEALPPGIFVRIHKSYLINIRQIQSIERRRVVIQDQFLPIGDTYLTGLKSRIPGLPE